MRKVIAVSAPTSAAIRRAQVAGRVGILAIRSQPADGGKGISFKEFNDPTAIRPFARPTRLLVLLQYDNYSPWRNDAIRPSMCFSTSTGRFSWWTRRAAAGSGSS